LSQQPDLDVQKQLNYDAKVKLTKELMENKKS
jgi:hypothetical protein